MNSLDWSAEIAALRPYVRGRAIELVGVSPGLIPGAIPLGHSRGRGGPDWGTVANQSVDCIVSLGAPEVLVDPVSEIQQWRRVTREGATLALIPGRAGPPLWLTALLNYLGGFEITRACSVANGRTWLLVAERHAIAEIRGPLGTLGPRVAEIARRDQAGLAELYLQIGTILLQAGDRDLADRCFAALVDAQGESAPAASTSAAGTACPAAP